MRDAAKREDDVKSAPNAQVLKDFGDKPKAAVSRCFNAVNRSRGACVEAFLCGELIYVQGSQLMMRNAGLHDLQFILSLILAEAANDHFSRELLIPAATRGFEIELRSILSNRVRHNGLFAYALIWEKEQKPIGFIIMSGGEGNKGNELWMSAILPSHRGCGQGKRMILEVLNQFKGRNLALFARCSINSEAMYHILTTHGFEQVVTGDRGSRGLIYTL